MKTRDNANQVCKEHSGVSAAPCSLIRIMPLAVTAWSITVISRSRASSPPLQLSWPHICSRAAAYIMSTTRRGSSNSWLADSSRAASNLTLEVKIAVEEARTPRDGCGSSRNLHSSPPPRPPPPTLTPEEPAALAKADAARARQEGLPRRARHGRRRLAALRTFTGRGALRSQDHQSGGFYHATREPRSTTTLLSSCGHVRAHALA